jgi:hypothetical protein
MGEGSVINKRSFVDIDYGHRFLDISLKNDGIEVSVRWENNIGVSNRETVTLDYEDAESIIHFLRNGRGTL